MGIRRARVTWFAVIHGLPAAARARPYHDLLGYDPEEHNLKGDDSSRCEHGRRVIALQDDLGVGSDSLVRGNTQLNQ